MCRAGVPPGQRCARGAFTAALWSACTREGERDALLRFGTSSPGVIHDQVFRRTGARLSPSSWPRSRSGTRGRTC
ncbi:hypothetical protein Q8A67_013092 [Cirrhinus molitorella]|uniref:Uncharacterized protein n=1 Tax=Cirrhinus molitorella TaxID=172907 RepID=A0AA88TWH6_9TELE|nr:hypothetical protein Q8A67_013092 [Cirrhinus molitorella]